MADAATTFKIKAIIEGAQSVNKLKTSIRGLDKPTRQSSAAISELRNRAKNLTKTTGQTRAAFRQQIQVFNELRDNVSLTSNRYRLLTRDIKQAERALASFGGAGGKSGGFMAGAKAAAPTALSAASASFLPASAQFGALAGFTKTGTLAGGAAGAGIGLGVAGVVGTVQQANEAAQYAAQVSRLEIALRAVTKSSTNYAKAQRIIQQASKELNVPIDIATKQFTQLSASVLGSNGTIEEAETHVRNYQNE